MHSSKKYSFIIFTILVIIGFIALNQSNTNHDERFISYIVDPKTQDIKLYWKNDKNVIFKSIANLKNWLDSNDKNLIFATNAGMYKKDNSPQGLFIDNGKTFTALDTTKGNGNFYLMPNGVFYIRNDHSVNICKTSEFNEKEKIKYATQSGPMLVIDGEIHSAFKKESNNLNIRNGVGILPNNTLIFAMSKNEINFYNFAEFFKKLDCKNALYLDGFVSRTYLPEQNWIQTDGNFGVIIGVSSNKK